MDDDMRRSLLNKKSATFDKQYEQCLIKIQRIKQKNDFMQKQVGTDVEEAVRAQVTNQKKFIEKQIKELKALMDDLDRKFKDPESKNKLKTLKMDAQKQVERNKIIMKDFINRSFLKISQGSAHSQQDPSQYMQGGNINYVQLDANARTDNTRRKKSEDQQNEQAVREQYNQSLLTDQNLDMDFQIERKILQEKNELLNEVEQTTLRVNEIMSDMAVMVNEQGEDLETISQQMMNTNKNLVQTNKELDQANTLQKRSRRKYMLFALLLIVLVAGVVGVIFLSKS